MANRFLGVADSATKLAAARSITLTGNVTGTANFDGSSNVSMGTNLALYITLGDGNGGGILQNGGTVWQRLSILDDAVAGNGVFSFQQSMDSGATWKDLLIVNDDGNVLASKFTGTLYGNATSATTATNATKLNNQDAAYYLNYNNFTNKPLDRELVNFYNAPSNTTLNIPVIFGQSSTATTYNKIGFSRWQQGDPYGLGLGSYGNIIGWHGDDTGSFLATAHNAPVVMIGGINGTANQYKNWQRKVCLYGEDGVSFTSSNSNALGGVAAANYVNTSDTVILVGTI